METEFSKYGPSQNRAKATFRQDDLVYPHRGISLAIQELPKKILTD